MIVRDRPRPDPLLPVSSPDGPRVSVVMPVFNSARYVGAAAASVLAQTFRAFELIAVNDGSTDQSLGILQRLARADARLRIISRPHTGNYGARNDGLAAARADLVACMDADDLAYPQRLEEQVHAMEARPDLVALGAAVRLIDPDGIDLGPERPPTDHDAIEQRLLHGDGSAIRQPVAMVRRAAVQAVGGYRREYSSSEDLHLFLRLAEVGKLANLSHVLLDYRQHLASVNRTHHAQQLRRREAIAAEECRRRFGADALAPEVIPWVQPSARESLLQWGWAALRQKRPRIALLRGFQAMGHGGPSWEALRMIACAIRAH